MKYMLIVLALCASAFGSAANIYITQTGSAIGNCTTNVQTPAFFNNATNWGAGSTQIGPGTTVLLCGTFTFSAGATGFQAQGSGSNGSPVTIQFDTGAILQSAYFAGNPESGCTGMGCGGGIDIAGVSYITVDGQNTGTIQNTANGTSMANQQASCGIFVNSNGSTSANNILIKNLTIQNIYNATTADSGAGFNSADICANNDSNGATNIEICHNTLTNAHSSIDGNFYGNQVANGPTACTDTQAASGVNIYGNTSSDSGWGLGHIGGGGSVNVYGNTCCVWTNWLGSTGGYHTNGMLANGDAGLVQTLYIYNNTFAGDFDGPSPTAFVYCTYGQTGSGTSCYVFNNVLSGTGNTLNNASCFFSSVTTSPNQQGPWFYFNNTISGCGYQFFNYSASGSNTWTIENNVFIGGSGSNTYYLAQNSPINFSTLSPMDYNTYYNGRSNGPWNYGSGSGTYSALSSWSAACSCDTHSQVANPNLAGNWHPNSGSPVIQTGANLTGLCSSIPALCQDAAGVQRPTSGNWDAGAYQFVISAEPAPALGMFAWDWDYLLPDPNLNFGRCQRDFGGENPMRIRLTALRSF